MSQQRRAGKNATARPLKARVQPHALGEQGYASMQGKSWLARDASLAAVVVVIAFLAIVRARVADVPLERDEGEYAYSGQLILQGVPPYQSAYNMKFPGTYYSYGAILALFGETPRGIHIGLLLVNAITIVMLFLLARQLLRDNMAAAVAAIAYGFFSIDRSVLGVFGHATHFVVLAAVAGLLVLFLALESRKPFTFIAAGVLLGLSVLMKQNGIFFLALGIGLAAWHEIWKSSTHPRSAITKATLVALGGALPFILLCVLFVAQGVFAKFWFWTFQYAKEYVSRVSISDAWQLFQVAIDGVTRTNRLTWLFAAAGVVLLWIVRWSFYSRILLTALLVISLLSVCPGFYFREHYFVLLLPAAALFCGVAALSLRQLLSSVVSDGTTRAIVVGVFAIATVSYIVNERDYLFTTPPLQMSRMIYGANPFVEAVEIGRQIQARTEPDDRVAVLGSEPEIYFYAKRRSATGYIYTYSLMEQQKYSPRMQDEMIEEVTSAHPKYVVYVKIPTSWLARNPKEKILTWSERYLSQCYDVIGITDILPNQTKLLWDAEVNGYKPQSEFVVYTFKSKSDASCKVPT